jgi:hypothetical protein
MKYSKLIFSSLVLSVSLNAQNGLQKASAKIGENVSTTLIQKLGGELKAQMIKNGPEAALGFCTVSAQTLTQEVSVGSHYNVKRVSLRDRNPINRADSKESAILSAWQNNINAGQALPAYEIRNDGNIDHYYKPLIINNEMCLKCHGDVDSQSQLGRAIKAAYPNDHAIGYKMGDLRGMIVVDIPVER